MILTLKLQSLTTASERVGIVGTSTSSCISNFQNEGTSLYELVMR
jgi:hypothetical protein